MRPIRHGVLGRSRATGSGPTATPMMRTGSAPGNLLPATGQKAGQASRPPRRQRGTANGVEPSRPSPLLPEGPYGMDRSVRAQRMPRRSANAQRPATR
jgi:hypothetical protein